MAISTRDVASNTDAAIAPGSVSLLFCLNKLFTSDTANARSSSEDHDDITCTQRKLQRLADERIGRVAGLRWVKWVFNYIQAQKYATRKQ